MGQCRRVNISDAWTASVLSFHIVQEDDKKVAKYNLKIDCNQNSWIIEKRYHQFRQLYLLVHKICHHSQFRSQQSIALKFPSRRLFGSRLGLSFLAKRTSELNDFIFLLVNDELYRNMECVLSFFSLDNVPTTITSVKRFYSQSIRELMSHFLQRTFSLFKHANISKNKNNIASSISHSDSVIDTHIFINDCDKSSCDNCINHFHRRLTIHDFDLVRLIGKGSFGNVFLSRFKHDEQLYAVKVISKSLIKEETDFRHIMSERNILTQDLDHPFLVKLKCTFQSESKLYIVMQYVNGGELFYHLQHEYRFNETRSKFYAAEIVCAFEYLHMKGIVYRDLKPENILLDKNGHVVLVDFGLAKELYQTCPTFTFCGTPEYLAPEIVLNQQYGIGVDWWCLGAVIYEMLVGLPPFYSKNRNEIFEKILNSEAQFPVGCMSSRAKDLIIRLLRRDPSKRLDVSQIKSHSFFEDIDWNKVYSKKYQPPFVPVIKTDLGLDNFDSEFLRTSISSSFYHEPLEGFDDSSGLSTDESAIATSSDDYSNSTRVYQSDGEEIMQSFSDAQPILITSNDTRLFSCESHKQQFIGFSYQNIIEMPSQMSNIWL